jgi:HEAT repeat protein
MSERGQGYFGFIHQTFEEHLVARYLAARTPEERWAYLDRRLHDPRWQEVILLTAGSLQGSNVDAIVSSILDAGSRNEQILHRDLMLSGRILSDDTSVTSGALLKRVMDGILQIAQHSQFAALRDQVREITARLAGGTNERYACETLETTVIDALPKIDLYLLGLLSKFRYDERRLLEALAACARNGDSDVRSDTARALAVLGIPGPLARATLFILSKDRTSDVAATAAVAMASDRSRSPEVVDTLVELLGHATARVRAAAAHSLGVLRPSRDDVRDILYGLLSDGAFRVRASAARAMARLRPKDQRQVDSMVSTLVHRGKDRDSYFYSLHDAPEWYGGTDPSLCVVPKDKRFLPGLLKLIEDRSRITRCRAAFALGRLQLTGADVYDALRRHLTDRSAYVRLAAVSSLLSLGTEDEDLARVIAKIALSDDPASWHARGLYDKLRVGRGQIEAGLLERLKRCDGDFGRRNVLEHLAALRSDSANVIGVFEHELRTTSNSPLRELAMEALLRTKPSSGTLRDALTDDLDNPESEVRLRASVMLAEAGAASEKALDLLAAQVMSEEKDDWRLMRLQLPRYESTILSSLDVCYGAMVKLAARVPRRTEV